MIRKLLLVALCALLLLIVSAPTLAQDVTPEPTPIVTPPVDTGTTVSSGQLFTTALIVIGAVASIALSVFGYIVRPAIAGVVASMPEWGANMLFSTVDSGIDAADTYAKTTPNPADDVEVARLRNELALLRQEVADIRAGQVSPFSG